MILKTFLLCSATLVACAFDTVHENEPPPKFDEYWYAGKAELSSYTIKQSRYGEYREGTSILVYVTEDFSNSKQVKLDNPSRNQDDVVPVLKFNQMRKFATGVYDYSIMQSTFTPIDYKKYPHTIKSVLSVQDWCGQSFTQLNLQTYKYKITQRSYFETEGDDEFQIEKNLLEDEIWNLIRIDPDALPTGNIQLIPSMITSQLVHRGLRTQSANATLQVDKKNKDLMEYKISYVTTDRKLIISFQKKFPHTIESWTESYIVNGTRVENKGTRKKTILSDYWNKNRNIDKKLRKELGLD